MSKNVSYDYQDMLKFIKIVMQNLPNKSEDQWDEKWTKTSTYIVKIVLPPVKPYSYSCN